MEPYQPGSLTRFTPEHLTENKVKLVWNPMFVLFLFGDGSMTNNLGLLTKSKPSVQVLKEQEKIPKDSRVYHDHLENLEGPHYHRAITMKSGEGKVLMYAESVWNKESYESVMQDKSIAIGQNISQQKFSYFREIHFCGLLEEDKEMNKILGNEEDDKILMRYYSMYNNGKKFCVIQEYFSKEINNILSVSFQ